MALSSHAAQEKTNAHLAQLFINGKLNLFVLVQYYCKIYGAS